MLCHACILGDTQRQPRGANNQKWSKTKGNKMRNGCLTPAFSRAQKGGDCYIAPTFKWIPNAKRDEQKVNTGAKQRERKSDLATSPLPSQKAQKGAEMVCHPCILGDPQRQARGAKISSGPIQKGTKSGRATSPLPSQGPNIEREYYVTPAFSGIPNAKRGEQKMRNGCLTPAFLGAQERAEMLRHPCIPGSPTPSVGSKKREEVPNKGERN